MPPHALPNFSSVTQSKDRMDPGNDFLYLIFGKAQWSLIGVRHSKLVMSTLQESAPLVQQHSSPSQDTAWRRENWSCSIMTNLKERIWVATPSLMSMMK